LAKRRNRWSATARTKSWRRRRTSVTALRNATARGSARTAPSGRQRDRLFACTRPSGDRYTSLGDDPRRTCRSQGPDPLPVGGQGQLPSGRQGATSLRASHGYQLAHRRGWRSPPHVGGTEPRRERGRRVPPVVRIELSTGGPGQGRVGGLAHGPLRWRPLRRSPQCSFGCGGSGRGTNGPVHTQIASWVADLSS